MVGYNTGARGASGTHGGRLRSALSRFFLILFGIASSLVLLEALLQAGAAYLRWTGGELPSAWLTGKERVLCLGDSNTYGLYLDKRTDAYPGALEQLWNGQAGARPVEVLNMGYPGANSSKLLSEFPRLLRTLVPDVVTVMIGANDFWTARAPIEDRGTDLAGRLWQISRVYRLLHLLRRAVQKAELEVELGKTDLEARVGGGSARVGGETFDLSWRGGTDTTWTIPRWTAALEANLAAMAAEASRVGVREGGVRHLPGGRPNLWTGQPGDPENGPGNGNAAGRRGAPFHRTLSEVGM